MCPIQIGQLPHRVVIDLGDETGVVHQHVEHLAGGADHGRRQGVGEGVGPRPLPQQRDQLRGARGVAARRAAQRLDWRVSAAVPRHTALAHLAQRGVDDVHAPLHAVELLRAAARGSEETGCMTLQVQAMIWSEKQTCKTCKNIFISF